MTALPTRKLEAYRYADIDALASVWSELSPPERVEIAAQQRLQQIWLPSGDEIDIRRVEMVLEAGAVVRCRRQDLESDEVREHLKSGKQVFQLGLVFDDRMSFVLGEDLVVRKLKFLDVVQDTLGEETAESKQAELDAVFALMTLVTFELP